MIQSQVVIPQNYPLPLKKNWPLSLHRLPGSLMLLPLGNRLRQAFSYENLRPRVSPKMGYCPFQGNRRTRRPPCTSPLAARKPPRARAADTRCD